MRYQRQGPGPFLTTLIAAVIVFGGYFIYTGAIQWVEADFERNEQATLTAEINQTDVAIQQATLNFQPFPTSTRVPNCEIYYVTVESAFVRQCPSFECRAREGQERYFQGNDVCTIGRATDFEYFDADEWFKIDLNFGESFLDIGYMHESVLKPRNPTPTPSQTFTPLPTITEIPTVEGTPTPTTPPTTPPPTITPTPDSEIAF
ncbi:MAG: hypothetical protein L0154_20545 [Chloroflexi bacterium]|nr:hypothetical protein [Chloroflexota bacterium]